MNDNMVRVTFYPGWMRVLLPVGKGFMVGSSLSMMFNLLHTGTINSPWLQADLFLFGAALTLASVLGMRSYRDFVYRECLRQGIDPDSIKIR